MGRSGSAREDTQSSERSKGCEAGHDARTVSLRAKYTNKNEGGGISTVYGISLPHRTVLCYDDDETSEATMSVPYRHLQTKRIHPSIHLPSFICPSISIIIKHYVSSRRRDRIRRRRRSFSLPMRMRMRTRVRMDRRAALIRHRRIRRLLFHLPRPARMVPCGSIERGVRRLCRVAPSCRRAILRVRHGWARVRERVLVLCRRCVALHRDRRRPRRRLEVRRLRRCLRR